MIDLIRDKESILVAWKDSPHRKPLLLQGARQTGKTWVIKKFGRGEFDDMACFNFDEEPALNQFFLETKIR